MIYSLRHLGSIFGLCVFIFSTSAAANTQDCEDLLKGLQLKQEEALKVASKVNDYTAAMNVKLLEREYIIDAIMLALIAREHVLLMGPPGNAKSMLADSLLGNIIELAVKADGTIAKDRSYYRIQMTPETTMSETHGPLDFKGLTETGKYERLYDEGMLHSRNVFIDEIFDGRANSMRNILGLLAERAHAQGPRIIPGRIETVVAATNKFISEVYERVGDDGPKALLDRFAFSAFVPGEFESVASYVQLIRGAVKKGKPLPELTFKDLDAVRALVPEVDVPQHVAEFLSLVSYRVKAETEAMEQAALKTYKQALRSGEEPAPPYRATKYHSPRTLSKAAGILKAIVVREWIKSGGKRPLVATVEDVRQLEMFFTLNGPNDAFLEAQLERSSNAHEKAQLSAIMQERQVFRRNFDQTLAEVNSGTFRFALTDLQTEVEAAYTKAEKEVVAKKLMRLLIEMEKGETNHGGRQSQLNGEHIGRSLVRRYLEDTLRDIVGEKYDDVVTKTLREIEEHRIREAEEIKRAEETRIREERRLELERKRAEEEAQRKAEEARKQAEALASTFTQHNQFQPLVDLTINNDLNKNHVAFAPDGLNMAFYSNNQLTLLKTDGSVARTIMSSDHTFSEVLRGGYGNVERVLMPDADHVILVTNSGAAWVLNTTKGSYIQDIPINSQTSPNEYVTLSHDGQELMFLDTQLRRVVSVNWLTGARNIKQIKELVDPTSSSSSETLENALNHMGNYHGMMRLSKDGKTAILTAFQTSNIYELDLATGVLTTKALHYAKYNRNQQALAGFSADRSKMYTWGATPNNPTIIIEIDLKAPGTAPKEHVVATNGLSTIKHIEVIENGNLAIIATDRNGLVLFDMNSNTIVAKTVIQKNVWTSLVYELADGTYFVAGHNGSYKLNIFRRK